MIKTMIVMEDDFRRGDEKVYVYSGHFNEIGDDADKIRHLGRISRQYYPEKQQQHLNVPFYTKIVSPSVYSIKRSY